MRYAERLRQLDALLLASREFWHPQPFREHRPVWCARWPALLEQLLALPDDAVVHLSADSAAAMRLLAACCPALAELHVLAALPVRTSKTLSDHGERWAWEIPVRKRQQIEAFAAAVDSENEPILDWCGGKGHLGRLLALQFKQPVRTLEIDRQMCAQGESLAGRLGLNQQFLPADALTAEDILQPLQHAVALHACGHLHRALIGHGARAGVRRLDVAPCCYHLGVKGFYPAFDPALQNRLSLDDTRLAVTETVTASPRLQRLRDQEMAWKLGFSELRRELSATKDYQSFKPVPAAWFRENFTVFMQLMAAREQLLLPTGLPLLSFEQIGWQRQREVMRLSIVRSAFRRALEVWLALDLVCHLERSGYTVELGQFCARELTPRNLLISARRH